MLRTKHAFCIWHIIAKFTDWFSMLLGLTYDEWKADSQQLYDLLSMEDFEAGWKEMVDKYGLYGNKHIISLFTLRSFWALLYLRCFFAGMINAFQSELINSFIQWFMSAQFHGDNFVEQAATIVEFKDEVGREHKIWRKVRKSSSKQDLLWNHMLLLFFTVCL